MNDATGPAGTGGGERPETPAGGSRPSPTHRPPTVPAPPSGASGSRGRRRNRSGPVLGIALLLVVLAGGALLVLRARSDDGLEWDDRVSDLAAFVEQQRGHRFERPVTVNFLDAEGYREAMVGEDDDHGEAANDEDDRWLETVRALGFVSGEIDQDEMTSTLLDTGTKAAYDLETSEIYIRGTEMTPELRVTLVHELTHALQHQHFDLDGILPSDDDPDDAADDGSGDGARGASTLRDIVEGDASRIEERYLESLDPDERRAVEQANEALLAEAEPILDAAVPALVQALFQAPYLYGTALVTIADADGGNAAVDRLLTDPPSEFAVYNPMNVDPGSDTAADQEILDVPLPEGSETIDDGSFGPLTWYLLLASVHGPHEAMALTDDIVADGFRSYSTPDGLCLTAHAKSLSPGDLLDGLRTWGAELDGLDVHAEMHDRIVVLTTCDPGPDGPEPPDVAVEIVALPAIRTFGYAGALSAGVPEDVARCFGEGMVEVLDVDDLLAGELDENPATLEEVAIRCAS